MAYSDFTNLNKVRNDFNLQIKEQTDLFAEVTPLPPVFADHLKGNSTLSFGN